jgi:hypothetical protein
MGVCCGASWGYKTTHTKNAMHEARLARAGSKAFGMYVAHAVHVRCSCCVHG